MFCSLPGTQSQWWAKAALESEHKLLPQSPSIDANDKMLLTHFKMGNAEAQGGELLGQPSATKPMRLDMIFPGALLLLLY